MSRRHVFVAALVAVPGLALVAVFGVAGIDGAARSVLAWIEGLGAWAPAVYVAVSALAIVLFLPASPLYMAAGILFGLPSGTAYAFATATAGGAAAFLVARYLARDAVERRINDHDALEALDRAVRREGLRAAMLIRCSPLLPTSLLNYALGLSSLRFSHHLAASVAALPGTFLYVYYGKALGDLSALVRGTEPSRGLAYYALLVGGAAATLLATHQITVRAKRILEAADADSANS